MASLNKGHHDQTGGVVIFSGELILLYCDAVNLECDNHGSSVNGRIYLTTHRIIFTAAPLTQNSFLKSFSAPFFAMYDLELKQPVFGANAIKGKVRHEDKDQPPLTFKLRFTHGGAIELGQAMSLAAKAASNVARQMNYFDAPPPAYTPTAAESYYDPGPGAYNPNYDVGFAMPTQMFSQAPPAGFVFASNVPPPYPGMTTGVSQGMMSAPAPGFAPGQQVYPQQNYPMASGTVPQPGFLVGDPAAAPPPYGGPQQANGHPSAPMAPYEQPPAYYPVGDKKGN